jgi:hypothetical protein
LLHNQRVIEEIRKKVKMFLEFNENESTTYQNLWDLAKAVLRGKFIAMSAYIKNTERSQIKCPNIISQTPMKTRTNKSKPAEGQR